MLEFRIGCHIASSCCHGPPDLRSSLAPRPSASTPPWVRGFFFVGELHLVHAATRLLVLCLELPSACAGTGLFSSGGEIMFRLERAEYDRETQRAYVELRAPDDDGGEVVTAIIFTFRTTAALSKQQIKEDIVRKARHLLKRASLAAEFV